MIGIMSNLEAAIVLSLLVGTVCFFAALWLRVRFDEYLMRPTKHGDVGVWQRMERHPEAIFVIGLLLVLVSFLAAVLLLDGVDLSS